MICKIAQKAGYFMVQIGVWGYKTKVLIKLDFFIKHFFGYGYKICVYLWACYYSISETKNRLTVCFRFVADIIFLLVVIRERDQRLKRLPGFWNSFFCKKIVLMYDNVHTGSKSQHFEKQCFYFLAIAFFMNFLISIKNVLFKNGCYCSLKTQILKN